MTHTSQLEARTRAYTVLLWAWTTGAIVYVLVLPGLEVGLLFVVPTFLFFFLVPVLLLRLRMRAAGAHKPYSPEAPLHRLPPPKPGLRKPALRGPWG